MSTEQLSGYVSEERVRGVTDDAIKAALLEKGWKEADVVAALGVGGVGVGVSAHQGMWSGRLDKSGYLKIVLLGVGFIALIVVAAFGVGYTAFDYQETDIANEGTLFYLGIFIGALFFLAYSIVGLGAGIRRLHDIGQSGWWICIGFIPYLGSLLSLALTIYLCVKDGVPTANQWGGVPRKDLTLWQSLRGRE